MKINLSILGVEKAYFIAVQLITKINLPQKEEIFQRKMNSDQNQTREMSFSDFLAKGHFFLYQSPQIASDSPVFFAKFR